MGLSPILSVIRTVTIDTMVNNNDVNNGHRLKTLRVNRPLRSLKLICQDLDLCNILCIDFKMLE